MFEEAKDLARAAQDRNAVLGELEQPRDRDGRLSLNRGPSGRWSMGPRARQLAVVAGILLGLLVLLGLVALVRS